ncbi:MAG: hypothetical protein MUO52_01930, partial [Desulfobacterales bacterium]|nr:hypothetical protein [Desulfobacterales bacterium]
QAAEKRPSPRQAGIWRAALPSLLGISGALHLDIFQQPATALNRSGGSKRLGLSFDKRTRNFFTKLEHKEEARIDKKGEHGTGCGR